MTKMAYLDPKRWHTTQAWRHRTELYRRDGHALCEWCLKDGKLTPATVVHHLEGYLVDGVPNWEKFMTGPVAALCKWHHDSVAQKHERGRPPQVIDADGFVVNKQKPGGAVTKKKTGT
jgi:hypothetical protein